MIETPSHNIEAPGSDKVLRGQGYRTSHGAVTNEYGEMMER
jgi:hypothetical protein